MANFTEISGRMFAVRSADCLYDGIDQVVCSAEIGSCSLQEQQMLRSSVQTLIRRRDGYGDRLP